MGAPVAAGWLAGDVSAGMIATLGAFTSLYGVDRPYRNRAVLLAVIALAFALVVCLGVSVQHVPAAVVVVVVLIAMGTTFLCNSLAIGPPGAYLFTLSCAAGTASPTQHLHLWQVGLLVLAGGAFAWLVRMTGVLFRPRGPEIAAVMAAAEAVARFAEAMGTPRQDDMRHAAALALHDAWTKLVTFQPARAARDPLLNRLRASNRELHLLFAQVIAAGGRIAGLESVAAAARSLAGRTTFPVSAAEPGGGVPLGRHGMHEAIRESLRWHSSAGLATLRVGAASAIAGAAGAALGIERAYWIVAAAVVVLHQGLDWTRTLQRGVERIAGTLVGLGLAGLILMLGPEGLWVAGILAALQFIIEMLVVRNYALAVVFITAVALIIASGGRTDIDVGHLLSMRGLDTVIGCLIGLGVHGLTAPRRAAVPVPEEIIGTLAALEAVLPFLARNELTSVAARRARRDLQHRAIVLVQAYDAGVGATAGDRAFAERLWPAVVATQRLAYRILAACWSLEEGDGDGVKDIARLSDEDLGVARHALADIRRALRTGVRPVLPSGLPPLLRDDLQALVDSLVLFA